MSRENMALKIFPILDRSQFYCGLFCNSERHVMESTSRLLTTIPKTVNHLEYKRIFASSQQNFLKKND